MTGVIYARYSSDNQREESIEGQLRACKVFAEKNGIDVVGTYIDRALSAKTDNRPDFQKMIKDSAKKQFDCVIVWKLDRFARNRYDSAHYKALLRKNGVRVLSAFKMYEDGMTMQEIADELNVKGIRNTRGTKLNINTVSNLLSNRRYMGEYYYRDIVIPDGIPAIVPKDLFLRVQERIAKNKNSPARYRADEQYILSTKLYCGKCMTFMVGESGTARNKNTYRYYKCLSAKRKRGCDKKAVKKDWIENLVINQIIRVIWDDNLIEDITDMVMDLQKNENNILPLLRKRQNEIQGVNVIYFFTCQEFSRKRWCRFTPTPRIKYFDFTYVF